MMLVTGAFMIFSLLSFSTVRNSLICPIQFGTAVLHTGYGGSFWLTLVIGKETKLRQGAPPYPTGCAGAPGLSPQKCSWESSGGAAHQSPSLCLGKANPGRDVGRAGRKGRRVVEGFLVPELQ